MRTSIHPRAVRLVAGLACLLFGMQACDGKDSARAVWRDLLSKCAQSDQMGGSLLYFGPSNNLGAGTVMRRAADGGFRAVWRLSDAPVSAEARDRSINLGAPATCQGKSVRTSKVGASAMVESGLAPITGSLQADLNRARSVTLSVGSWAIEEVVEGPFTAMVTSIPADNDYRASLSRAEHFVAGRLVRVTGMAAELEFTSDVAAGLQARYTGPVAGTGIQGSVALSGRWTSATTLRLESNDTFYIAGELYRLTGGGFAGDEGRLLPVAVDPSARLGPSTSND